MIRPICRTGRWISLQVRKKDAIGGTSTGTIGINAQINL